MSGFLRTLIVVIFFLFFNSCSFLNPPFPPKKLTKEEHHWVEKFLRYWMFEENGIYTLLGSKPLIRFQLVYYDTSEEVRRQKETDQYAYFLLNKNDKNDQEFFKKLSKDNKKKAILISDCDFIYNFEELWEKWEKIQDRFPLKKKFLLVKRERKLDPQRSTPHCIKIYDIFFVDVYKTAYIIQENYELFKKAVDYDFDPIKVVLDIQNPESIFWNKIQGYKYSYLWGLLYGYGKENSFYHYWQTRSLWDNSMGAAEKKVSQSIEKHSSNKKIPNLSNKNSNSIKDFCIPFFCSYKNPDPIIEKYTLENKQIKKLYRGKDFVSYTLELLTE